MEIARLETFLYSGDIILGFSCKKSYVYCWIKLSMSYTIQALKSNVVSPPYIICMNGLIGKNFEGGKLSNWKHATLSFMTSEKFVIAKIILKDGFWKLPPIILKNDSMKITYPIIHRWRISQIRNYFYIYGGKEKQMNLDKTKWHNEEKASEYNRPQETEIMTIFSFPIRTSHKRHHNNCCHQQCFQNNSHRIQSHIVFLYVEEFQKSRV